jgi:hypothetical protein
MLSFKSGITSAIALATLSLASAGILGTNFYQDGSDAQNLEQSVINLAYITNGIKQRLKNDLNSQQSDVNGTSDEFKTPNDPQGENYSFWFSSSEDHDPASGSRTEPASQNLTKWAQRFLIGRNTCFKDTNGYKPRSESPFDKSTKTKTSLIPCNLFRVVNRQGPLFNSAINVSTIDFTFEDKTLHPTPSTSLKARLINQITLTIPLTDIAKSHKSSSRVLMRLPRYINKQITRDGIIAHFEASTTTATPVDINYGLSSSFFATNDCTIIAKQCKLVINFTPEIIIESGCTDCLKTDGSNSMVNSPITFDGDADIKNYTGNLLVWDRPNDSPNVAHDDAIDSGLVAIEGGLRIKIKMNSDASLQIGAFHKDSVVFGSGHLNPTKVTQKFTPKALGSGSSQRSNTNKFSSGLEIHSSNDNLNFDAHDTDWHTPVSTGFVPESVLHSTVRTATGDLLGSSEIKALTGVPNTSSMLGKVFDTQPMAKLTAFDNYTNKKSQTDFVISPYGAKLDINDLNSPTIRNTVLEAKLGEVSIYKPSNASKAVIKITDATLDLNSPTTNINGTTTNINGTTINIGDIGSTTTHISTTTNAAGKKNDFAKFSNEIITGNNPPATNPEMPTLTLNNGRLLLHDSKNIVYPGDGKLADNDWQDQVLTAGETMNVLECAMWPYVRLSHEMTCILNQPPSNTATQNYNLCQDPNRTVNLITIPAPSCN